VDLPVSACRSSISSTRGWGSFPPSSKSIGQDEFLHKILETRQPKISRILRIPKQSYAGHTQFSQSHTLRSTEMSVIRKTIARSHSFLDNFLRSFRIDTTQKLREHSNTVTHREFSCGFAHSKGCSYGRLWKNQIVNTSHKYSMRAPVKSQRKVWFFSL